METLRDYLTKNEIRQRQFAETIGVSVSHLSDMLTGRRLPSLHLAVKIAEATDWEVRPEDWVSDAETT